MGWVDYATGFDISLIVFYFAPIAIAAWYLGMGGSLLFGILAAGVLTWAEIAGGRHYAQRWILWEQIVMRVIVFGMVSYGFSFMKRALEKEREKVRRLEGATMTFCACCTKVRDPRDNWVELGTFLRENTSVEARAKLCPSCSREAYAATAKTFVETRR